MSGTTRCLTHLRRRLHQSWGRGILRQAGVLAPLRAFVAARPPEAHRPDYADLAYLYRAVQQQRPRVVLEFGSGCSTLVLALALQRTGASGQVVSLESDPAWRTQTVQALPDAIRPWCQVVLSPLVAMTTGLAGYTWAARPPDLVPELIYLDGPGLTPAHTALQGLCALDVLHLEPTLAVGCRVVVDGRPGQTAFLRQHLRRAWTFHRDHTMDRHVFTLGEETKPC